MSLMEDWAAGEERAVRAIAYATLTCPECGEPAHDATEENLVLLSCRCGWSEVVDTIETHDRHTVYVVPVGYPGDRETQLYQLTAGQLVGAKIVFPARTIDGYWHEQEWHKVAEYRPAEHRFTTLGKQDWNAQKTMAALTDGTAFIPRLWRTDLTVYDCPF